MKPLRTELFVKKPDFTISLRDPVFTLGSCFADAMGQQLVANKFNVQVNPFGTVYNPVSIHRLLRYCVDDTNIDDTGYLKRDDFYFHHDFHST
ncbi:MAG: GSCFA domain-containing protein, partial [Cytophagales bacterium]